MKKVWYSLKEITDLLLQTDIPYYKVDDIAKRVYELSFNERDDLSMVLNLMSWSTKK